jgi:transposase
LAEGFLGLTTSTGGTVEIFVGVDWAEAHHDVCVMDGSGTKLGKRRVPEGIEGVRSFHELVEPFIEDPSDVRVGIETDRGLFVGALVAAGYKVHAVNPFSASRYRDRHSSSGAKSDSGDAEVLADLVRTDAHNHREVAGDTDLAEAVKILARAHQSMIWTRGRQTNTLRSTLREYYPNALVALGDDLHAPEALEVLSIAPTPTLGRQLSKSKIASALRRAGRQRRIDERTDEIQGALRTQALEAPAIISGAFGSSVAASARVIVELNRQIDELEKAMGEHFEQHPDAKIVLSLPGLGTVLGARVLGEFGDDASAMPVPSLARITPARLPSPGHRGPSGWFSPVLPATAGSPMPPTCGPSVRSQSLPAPGPSMTATELSGTATTKP